MEKTLIILKPDAVGRGLVGELLNRFEKTGLKIVGVKMLSPSQDHYHHHYETIGKLISRRGEDAYKRNAAAMMVGPVIAVVLEGINAVAQVRKMVGSTEPSAALPGTIRGDYAHMTIAHADAEDTGLPNLIHASGDPAEAKEEISHWFTKEELFNYKNVHQDFTQTKKK